MRHCLRRMPTTLYHQMHKLTSGSGFGTFLGCPRRGCVSSVKVLNMFNPRCRGLSCKRAVFRFAIGLILFLVIAIYLLFPGNEIKIPADVQISAYEPFEPDVTEEFPQGETLTPKIPKIIHQTFQHTSIPPSFQDNIKRLVKNNPDWTYYLWTDESSRQFIKDTHPYLLPTFDGYHEGIRRADFIRYVVLYELGGVYADLDTFNYRSLNVAITKYTCIFPTEPFEHATLRAFVPYLMNNAIMFCKPKHPFLKMILEYLPRFEHMFKVLDATGPSFVTTMFMIYNNLSREGTSPKQNHALSNSPYFYKGKLPEDHPDAVYVPNTQYFCNNIDTNAILFFYQACKSFHTLNELEKRACVTLKRRGIVRKPNKFAILEHQFYRTYAFWHFYNYLDIYLYMFSKDIHELVPNCRIYKSDGANTHS